MARRKLTSEEKIEVLKHKADVGAEMAQFVDNPVIQEFFKRLRDDAANKLINLPLEDDKGRLVAATTHQVLRKLENYMRVVHKMGERSEGAYADMMAKEAERLGDSEDA